MRIHYLQHVPFETPERILDWAKERGHELTGTLLHNDERLPFQNEFDALIIMGGPMGVYDEETFNWLSSEKRIIRETIEQRKPVLGICLGAQLIAEAIGGSVYRNNEKEIGWFPVHLTEEAVQHPLFKDIPSSFVPFHWHGDTFELPKEAIRMASSEGCANQAFVYQERVVGLQFHLESSHGSIARLIEHCPDDLDQGRYVQQPDEMLDQADRLIQSNTILYTLLNAWETPR